MNPRTTALVLIGYQNDYFAEDGILHGVIESSTQSVLRNTLTVIRGLEKTDALIITTPINFTPDYSELIDPVGILQVIKEAGAFKAKTTGAQTIPEFADFTDRIIEIPGKRGLNAFASTNLDKVLKKHGITTIALAGAITSICIDSTGRAAFEKGYKVIPLSDCISSRTSLEESFYCSTVFPLYANVMDSRAFLKGLGARKPKENTKSTPRNQTRRTTQNKSTQSTAPKTAPKTRASAKPKTRAKPKPKATATASRKPRQSAKPKQPAQTRRTAQTKANTQTKTGAQNTRRTQAKRVA